MRSFRGSALARIAFPLGGIGTGCVSLAGRGSLVDFEIRNGPAKGCVIPHAFFAASARVVGSRARSARVLAAPPSELANVQGFGGAREQGEGLPHLRSAVFRGEVPFAWVRFADSSFPLRVALRAWSPMAPLDAEASGLPVALLEYTFTNPGERAVEASAVGSLFNAVGLLAGERTYQGRHPALGGNRNRLVREKGLFGVAMSQSKHDASDPRFGTLFLGLLDAHRPLAQTRWFRGAWFDDLQLFWDRFARRGDVEPIHDCADSPDGRSDTATVGARLRLAAGEQATLRFLLAWHFPVFTNDWNPDEPLVAGRRLSPAYASRFADATAVAAGVHARYAELEARTRRFHAALYASTLPPEALDAATRQLSTLRTPTCLHLADGRFHAFEGCLDRRGCCPMDCTHVWNYAQTLAHVYPALERSMRETALRSNVFPDGRQAFRSLVPLERGARWDRKPSADGQMGELLKLYRDWQLHGDEAWLRSLWPAARRVLEYAFVQWDADNDGVMEGEQHTTYDIEFYGPNPMVGTLYLGALRAGAELADALGDTHDAARYRALAEAGARRLDRLCWNGAYYEQRLPKPEEIRGDAHRDASLGGSLATPSPDGTVNYQVGRGCLSDQLLGQWFAHVVGLGALLPEAHVRRAARAIFAHNFHRELREHACAQRVYALPDEAGLVLCSWPRGGRPLLPFVYADEVWTGIEYAVAALLVWEDLVPEALEIVRATCARHDGVRRNPWDESECGHHYARAMSAWSLLLALSGFRYRAPARHLEFAPRVNAKRFRCFYSTAQAWGSYRQQRQGGRFRAVLEAAEGTLPLRSFGLVWPRAPRRLRVLRPRDATLVRAGDRLRLEVADEILVHPDAPLRVEIERG